MSIGIGVWKVGKRWWGAARAEEDGVRGDFKKERNFKGGENFRAWRALPGNILALSNGRSGINK